MPDGSNRHNLTPQEQKVIGNSIAELESYSRAPFRRILITLLDAAPPEDRLRIWAAQNPGKWGQLTKIFSLLSGYTEKTESLVTLETSHIIKMSDADLLTAIQHLQQNSTVNLIESMPIQEHEQTANNFQPVFTHQTLDSNSLLDNSNTMQTQHSDSNSTAYRTVAAGVRAHTARAAYNPFQQK